MACNCATKEQIDELYKKFGEKKNVTKKEGFKFKVKKILTNIGIVLCCIVLTPLIVIYVLYKAFGDDNHKISVTKFFNLKNIQVGSNVG